MTATKTRQASVAPKTSDAVSRAEPQPDGLKGRLPDAQRSAGNQAVSQAVSSMPNGALTTDQKLDQLRRSADQVMRELQSSKMRRDLQDETNSEFRGVSKTSEIASSVTGIFRGKGFRNVKLPAKSHWTPSDELLGRVRMLIAERDVLGAAQALQELSTEYAREEAVLLEYLDEVIGGAEVTTTGLQVAAVAGAIAAMIASGGLAAGGAAPLIGVAGVAGGTGVGILGTSAAVGVGAGTYGLAQQTATQSGEMIAGSREEFDLTEILKRGGKDAVMGFFGSLTGGYLAKWAVPYVGRIVMSRASPAQVAALAEKLGVNAVELTPAVFLNKGHQLLIDFLAGLGSTPLMTAIEAGFNALEGKPPQSWKAFGKSIIDNAVAGGLVQLFLAPLTHGAGRKPGKPHGELPIADAPPEMQLQSTNEGMVDLHAQSADAPAPVVDTPAVTDTAPMVTETAPASADGDFQLQSMHDQMADVQSSSSGSFSESADVPLASFDPAPAPEVTTQSASQSTADLQLQAGVPQPGAHQQPISPDVGGKPMEFRTTPSDSPNPRKAELQQSGLQTNREVAAGASEKGSKTQTTALVPHKIPKKATPAPKSGGKRDITREEQTFDIHDSKKRRKAADKIRHDTLKPGDGELKAGDPDPALPGQTVKAAEQDHIVAFRKIRNLKGFAQLDPQAQLEILNAPENLEMVSKPVNNSRLDTPYAEWDGVTKDGLKVDPAWLAKMIAKEQALEKLLEQRIADLLKAQALRDWRLRLGMPEGYDSASTP